LLNDLDSFRSTVAPDEEEEVVAHRWVTQVFEPVVMAVPRELRRKLEQAEVFHEVLEHRWFMSERQGHAVSLEEAVQSYVRDVLATKPDEKTVILNQVSVDDTMEMPVYIDTAEMPVISDED
jgi:hypothetical protein